MEHVSTPPTLRLSEPKVTWKHPTRLPWRSWGQGRHPSLLPHCPRLAPCSQHPSPKANSAHQEQAHSTLLHHRLRGLETVARRTIQPQEPAWRYIGLARLPPPSTQRPIPHILAEESDVHPARDIPQRCTDGGKRDTGNGRVRARRDGIRRLRHRHQDVLRPRNLPHQTSLSTPRSILFILSFTIVSSGMRTLMLIFNVATPVCYSSKLTDSFSPDIPLAIFVDPSNEVRSYIIIILTS